MTERIAVATARMAVVGCCLSKAGIRRGGIGEGCLGGLSGLAGKGCSLWVVKEKEISGELEAWR